MGDLNDEKEHPERDILLQQSESSNVRRVCVVETLAKAEISGERTFVISQRRWSPLWDHLRKLPHTQKKIILYHFLHR